MKNKYFVYSLLLITIYLYLYISLLKNVNLWIYDLKACFSVMNFTDFLENHLNVFFYLLLTSVMSIFLIKASVNLFKDIFTGFQLLNALKKIKSKQYKNLYLIKDETVIAFNMFNKIFISEGALKKLSKDSLKAIFYHEIGHLKNFHSLKLLIINFSYNLLFLPQKKEFLKNALLELEVEADKNALKFITMENLAYTLLNIKEMRNSNLMMNTFTLDRLQIHFHEKKIELSKFYYLVLIFIFLATVIVNVYRTCFCGLM